MSHQSTTTGASRYFLFGAIALIAVVSVVLAVVLPRLSGDIRNKAWSSPLCAGSVDMPLSACNEGCTKNEHCAMGNICYIANGQTTGVCRNPAFPTVPTCGTPSPTQIATPTPRPTVAPTPTAVPTGTPTPTSTPSACADFSLPETRVYTLSDKTDVVRLLSGGPVSYRWVGVIPTDNYRQFGEGSGTLQNGQSFTITYPTPSSWGPADENGAHEAHVTLHFTSTCGYKGHDFDRWFHDEYLQSGAPDARTSSATANIPVKLSLVSSATGEVIPGYEELTDGMRIPQSVTNGASVVAYPISDAVAGTIQSVRFDLNGALRKIESSAPYSMTGDTSGVPAAWRPGRGVYVLKISAYAQKNAAGAASVPLSIGLEIVP